MSAGHSALLRLHHLASDDPHPGRHLGRLPAGRRAHLPGQGAVRHRAGGVSPCDRPSHGAAVWVMRRLILAHPRWPGHALPVAPGAVLAGARRHRRPPPAVERAQVLHGHPPHRAVLCQVPRERGGVARHLQAHVAGGGGAQLQLLLLLGPGEGLGGGIFHTNE